tara:strand:+ start:1476 stop:2441 length:966 start_codon:yes stop_codon:yes gene_type:complete
MCKSISQIEKGAHETRASQYRIHKAEEIDEKDFQGERKKDRKKVERRALKLSEAINEYLKFKTRSMVRDLTREIKQTGKILKVRKAGPQTREEKKLLRLLSIYGMRQITESGEEYAGSKWTIPADFISEYLSQKEILIQRLDSNIEKEFRQTVGRALASWMREDPRPTIGQISERLRNSLTVASQDDSPRLLKPLGNKFTAEGLGARARMIARTEINGARNYGRFEAGKLMGRTHLLWLASNDGKSGKRRHDRMSGLVVEMGKPFVNPTTGSEILYPGDPNATKKVGRGARVVRGNAGEIINCRCSVRPITARMADRLKRK